MHARLGSLHFLCTFLVHVIAVSRGHRLAINSHTHNKISLNWTFQFQVIMRDMMSIIKTKLNICCQEINLITKHNQKLICIMENYKMETRFSSWNAYISICIHSWNWQTKVLVFFLVFIFWFFIMHISLWLCSLIK